MAATESDVTRATDATGTPIKTFDDDEVTPRKVQAVALDPEIHGDLLDWKQTAGTAENTNVAKASAGRFFRARVILDAAVAANRWLMVFDKATAPVNTDVPVLRAWLGNGTLDGEIDLGLYGRAMANGVSVALSTTVATLTLPGGSEAYFQVGYH
jgi:hypothetical protein